MRSPISLVLPICLGLAGCGQLLGLEDLNGPSGTPSDGPPGDTMTGPSAECLAQRAVYLVGGNGGLSWFTLAWPPPEVITNFQAIYAYDNPANAKNLTTDPAHPLYARINGNLAIWEGLGKDPHPSVFVAGTNETHTQQPSSISANGNLGMIAAGSVIQSRLQPTPQHTVLVFNTGGFIGPAPGAPPPVYVTSVESAIGLFSPALQPQLRPTAAQMAAFIPPNATIGESDLGARLAFTANAFRLGLLGSVVIQAYSDDPHGVFSIGVTQRANNLSNILDAFYRELGTANEPACGVGGRYLSLADNVVMSIVGDTPKNSFNNQGWPDGTVGLANWTYLRSNGFTKPGWFGQISNVMNGRTNFNPNTGALEATATNAASTGAAFAATLYAISRGSKPPVQALTNLPFDGVILR